MNTRMIICLLITLPWMVPVCSAVDVVSSASPPPQAPLPAPDSEGTTSTITMGAAKIYLFIEGRPFALSQQELRDWVQRSAEIVLQYYGGFPITESWVAIRGARGSRVMRGQAIGSVGAVINVDVGLAATPEALADDWILVHELIHVAFPSMARRHHWLEEGLSVYVESIARANAGVLSEDAVWTGFLDGMPLGLPRAGDKGLDYTPTWGRTYWGGALFCLLADIGIREQSHGQKTLRDALRAIVAAGYNMTRPGDVRTVLAIGDQATGVTVLLDLYEEMHNQPSPATIDSLWSDLGVAKLDGKIIYDDRAPQATIRRALTRPASQ
ncbi:MAG: hypothetical protein QGH93_02590 [Gammaproteobacteria bacterium]|jgi:hypothetical protein|nr:hypothetical protein [Gammaproteobacteria bacterium]